MTQITSEYTVVDIHHGWYHSAGRRFGWFFDGLACEGVGINKSFFVNPKGVLAVRIAGRVYYLAVKEAVAFIAKYKSTIKMPGGSYVGVVSKSILEEKITN